MRGNIRKEYQETGNVSNVYEVNSDAEAMRTSDHSYLVALGAKLQCEDGGVGNRQHTRGSLSRLFCLRH